MSFHFNTEASFSCTLNPLKEVNILLLGEKGVGKSTWINSFRNYLTYGSLEKAMEEKLLTLVPSELFICDNDFHEVTISVGPVDSNENYTPGKSATQDSKVYQFTFGSTIVRLIDTPGIGNDYDSDRKAVQNIISTLSNFEELHGICILLKANNARLHVMFEYCIKELLTNLHKDASQNILFCFTNTRGTFYKPGGTLPALQGILSKIESVEITYSRNTVYCFDSEAYRFLAATKNEPPIKFDDADVENFSNSWNKSIQETARVLEHICKLKPHKIKSTVNLYFARESILHFTKLSAKIRSNDLQIDEFVCDLCAIKNGSKKLALFVIRNSIIPYNDGLEAYLRYHIKYEQRIKYAEELQNLEEFLRQFIEEKNLLDKFLKSACESEVPAPETEEVKSLVEELAGLPHAGPQIKHALKYLKQITDPTYTEIRHVHNKYGIDEEED